MDAVEVVVKVPITLHEAKTPWILVAESGGESGRGIIQRAPDAFAGAGPQGEPI